MFDSSKFSRLLAILVTLLVLSPCWASPASLQDLISLEARARSDGTKTPSNKPETGGPLNARPQTPESQHTGGQKPSLAPSKDSKGSKPLMITTKFEEWLTTVKA
jgi:hypothetical protein